MSTRNIDINKRKRRTAKFRIFMMCNVYEFKIKNRVLHAFEKLTNPFISIETLVTKEPQCTAQLFVFYSAAIAAIELINLKFYNFNSRYTRVFHIFIII